MPASPPRRHGRLRPLATLLATLLLLGGLLLVGVLAPAQSLQELIRPQAASLAGTLSTQDSLALVALYDNTGGDSWTNNAGLALCACCRLVRRRR